MPFLRAALLKKKNTQPDDFDDIQAAPVASVPVIPEEIEIEEPESLVNLEATLETLHKVIDAKVAPLEAEPEIEVIATEPEVEELSEIEPELETTVVIVPEPDLQGFEVIEVVEEPAPEELIAEELPEIHEIVENSPEEQQSELESELEKSEESEATDEIINEADESEGFEETAAPEIDENFLPDETTDNNEEIESEEIETQNESEAEAVTDEITIPEETPEFSTEINEESEPEASQESESEAVTEETPEEILETIEEEGQQTEENIEPEVEPIEELENPINEANEELKIEEAGEDITVNNSQLPASIAETIGESAEEPGDTAIVPENPELESDEPFQLKYDVMSGERYVDKVSTKTEFDKMLDELAAISKDLLSWQVEKFAKQYTGKFSGESSEADARKYEAFLGGYITNAAMTLYDNGYKDAAIKQLEQAEHILVARKKLEDETAAIKERVVEEDAAVDLSDILGMFGDG